METASNCRAGAVIDHYLEGESGFLNFARTAPAALFRRLNSSSDLGAVEMMLLGNDSVPKLFLNAFAPSWPPLGLKSNHW